MAFPDAFPPVLAPSDGTLVPSRLVADIRAADQRLRAWAWLPPTLSDSPLTDGPLRGLAFGVKDIIDVAGMPTHCGSSLPQLDVARPFDASVVAQLRQAGAVPVGKTVTAEFAYMSPGPTCNPWNALHTPGGSSSGSAAAVAQGMVPFALGTQTGGSMIRPAAFNGVVGFKPSLGRVHRGGMTVQCESLDTIGWFTRDVALSRRVLQVLLPDAAADTPVSADAGVPAVAGATAGSRVQDKLTTAPALRVAFLPCQGLGGMSDAAGQVLAQAVARLREAGCTVDIHHPDAEVDALQQLHGHIMHYELARALLPIVQTCPQGLSMVLRDAIQRGLSVSLQQYDDCQQERARLQAVWQQRFAAYDVLLTPSAPGEAPEGLQATGSSAFNRIWSLLGWPSVHLPTAVSAGGLPLGVQLVGQPRGDALLLSLADTWHGVLDARPPGFRPA